MNDQEIWKDVVGFEGWYEVSDLGRIRSLTRIETKIRLNKKFEYVREGRILKGDIDFNGYLRVTLTKRIDFMPIQKTCKVHCLVMESFKGMRPDGYHIDHLNRDTTDARLCNLEYVTPRENVVRGILCDQNKAKACKFRGITKADKNGNFIARKVFDKERFYLGTFKSADEAHEVYEITTHELAIKLRDNRPKHTHIKFDVLEFLKENLTEI